MATTQNFFLVARKKGKKKVEGRRHDSWRRLSIVFLLPEKGKKTVEVVAETHGDNLKILVARSLEKFKGCRLEFRRQPSTFCLDRFP